MQERPNLTGLSADIIAYIESLEEALLQAQSKSSGRKTSATSDPTEAPTTMQVVSVTRTALAKRTPRHLYSRQNRGGMGVFDIELSDDHDAPAHVAVADLENDLIVVTDQGRVFRVAVATLVETPIRGRGTSLTETVSLLEAETIVAVLPADANQYLVITSERGWVRRIASNYVNHNMHAGMRFHKMSEGGKITAACWSDGDSDLFIATRSGIGIRFSERQVPSTGCLGLRVDPADRAITIASTNDDGGVFLLNDEGKGTIRLMSGFRKNKAPGAGGKVVMKTDALVGAVAVTPEQDLLAISETSKLIRFSAETVPPKTGVVQGVNCINLRADTAVALVASDAGESVSVSA